MLDTYIINLERATQRWKHIIQRVSATPYYRIHRIPAVEGAQLDLDQIPLDTSTTRRYFGQPLGRGSIGCYLSHVRAWETFIASHAPYGLILEDDACFDPTLLFHIIQSIIVLPKVKDRPLWDICSFQLNHRGAPIPVAKISNTYTLSTYLTCVTGGGAYVLNRYAAQQLFKHAFPIQWPVDHYYTKTHRLRLRFTGIEPRIAWQEEGPSFIEAAGRERLKKIPTSKRWICAGRKTWEEAKQGMYNASWAFWKRNAM